ncbi:MAG: hypothetical protein JRI97_04130 [Deltaproteobacteria bacterium]|nr:hypothetical protein [Deltaproteobacteria bacterium]
MAENRSIAFLLAIAACLALAACARVGVKVPGPTAEQAAAELAARCASLPGYKALGTMNYQSAGTKVSGRAAWMGAPPEKLRVEVLSPFGQPVFRLASDGETLMVDAPGEDEIRSYSPKAALSRILGADVSVPEFWCLLAGGVGVPEFSGARWEEKSPEFPRADRVLAVTGAFGRVLVRVGLKMPRMVPTRAVYYSLAGQPRLEVGFAPPGNAFALYSKNAMLLVEVERFEQADAFPEGAFSLQGKPR